MTDEPTPFPAPPLAWRLGYRILDRRLPPEYGPWLAADLTAPGWQWRTAVTKYLHLLLEVLAVSLVLELTLGRVWTPLKVFAAILAVFMVGDYVRARQRPGSARKEILNRQGIDREGRPLPPPTGGLAGLVDRVRRRLVPGREYEAAFYGLAFLLALDATAAIGLHLRPEPLSDPVVAPKNCVRLEDPVRRAIEATLRPPSVRLGQVGAVQVEGQYVVAARLEPALPGAAGHIPVVWFVREEGSGYRVSVWSLSGVEKKTTARGVEITDPQSAQARAIGEAVRCQVPGAQRR